jgi:hypothetical protein
MIENKVIYVNAFFKPVGKDVAVLVPTGEKKKGLFGGEKEITRKEFRWQQTGFSECKIDGERLSNDIAKAIAQLNHEDYEVISMLPIISGNYYYKYEAMGITSSPRILGKTEAVSGGASYGFGYGYSYTEGVSIIARKIS